MNVSNLAVFDVASDEERLPRLIVCFLVTLWARSPSGEPMTMDKSRDALRRQS
jgi:hypothetical protein